jgi:hypothetical protein
MEKVKIKSVVDVGRLTKDGNPIISVELEDGRKCTAFVADALNWQGEMELEVKEGKLVGDVQYYNVFIPKQKTQKSFAPKDYTFEKRSASLELAIKTADLASNPMRSAEILAVAETYFQYLNKR